MLSNNPVRSPSQETNTKGSNQTRQRQLTVFMMDLLSIVPYYDGHLCSALAQEEGICVQLGAITYQHDRSYFRRHRVRNNPGLLDIASRLTLPPGVLAPLKALECLINLAALAVRFVFSRPDLIHVQFIPLVIYVPIELWFLRAARALGVKVVYTVHNVLPPDMGIQHKATYEAVYRLAHALICHDERAKERLVGEFAIYPNRIRVISHGPLFDNTCAIGPREARAVVGLPPDECLVLFQGILDPYKGVPFLLKAWQCVCASGVQAKLAIVGNGSKKRLREIREIVAGLGITYSVRLELRFVSLEELRSWYLAADVVVYPYSNSTTSGALMTGINFGKPIVATTIPPFQQILRHGEDALLVDYGDVEGLSRNLERLIRDECLRRQMGARINELRANTPGWSTIAKQTRACYEDLTVSMSRRN